MYKKIRAFATQTGDFYTFYDLTENVHGTHSFHAFCPVGSPIRGRRFQSAMTVPMAWDCPMHVNVLQRLGPVVLANIPLPATPVICHSGHFPCLWQMPWSSLQGVE